jgi:hypothetical protein
MVRGLDARLLDEKVERVGPWRRRWKMAFSDSGSARKKTMID